MADITIKTGEAEHRATKIAIGFTVLAVLTWWQFTGSLPFLASAILPDPPDGKTSSVQSFVLELFADGLYFVGAFAVTFASGIWSFVIGLIQMAMIKLQSNKQSNDIEKMLDERTERIFRMVEVHLNNHDERIEKLESKNEPEEAVLPPPPTRKTRARS
jgi:hypothetical protein